MARIRLLLVENHPLVQRAYQEILSPHCIILDTLDAAEKIALAVRIAVPDVLLMDVSLPGRSGLQVLPEVRQAFPNLAIVIATNHASPIYRKEALKRGADVFFSKDRLHEELWPAVRRAHTARIKGSDLFRDCMQLDRTAASIGAVPCIG